MKGKAEIIVATRNRGKIREFREALKGLGFRIRSLNDYPDAPQIVEDGRSFTENALKKARFYAHYFGRRALADDSGLEVSSLKGAPGVYSARYAGEGASDRENNKKLLREMKAIPFSKRGAQFRCCIALVLPEGKEAFVEGSCRGKIGFREVGRKGFGYDPLFVLHGQRKTMAQLRVVEKNQISHRGKALRKLRRLINKLQTK